MLFAKRMSVSYWAALIHVNKRVRSPRRGSAVHAAPDSLGRDLASGGALDSSGPRSRLATPARRLAGLVRDSFAV